MNNNIIKKLILTSAIAFYAPALIGMENCNTQPETGLSKPLPHYPSYFQPHIRRPPLPWPSGPWPQITQENNGDAALNRRKLLSQDLSFQSAPQRIGTPTNFMGFSTALNPLTINPPLNLGAFYSPDAARGWQQEQASFAQHYLPHTSSLYWVQDDSSVEDINDSFEEATGGMKMHYSSLLKEFSLPPYWLPSAEAIPLSKHALYFEDIFYHVSLYLPFKAYISGLSSTCSVFRHWVIGKIVCFSAHKESSVPLSEKSTCIPEDYKRIIIQNKYYLTAFTSLTSLNYKDHSKSTTNDPLELMGDYFIEEGGDPDLDERHYLLQAEELLYFTNLHSLDLRLNRTIEAGGCWARNMTNLTSLKVSLSDSSDLWTAIDPELENFVNLKKLSLECCVPLNYKHLLRLTGLTHLKIDMYSNMYDNFKCEGNAKNALYGDITEGKLWKHLPKLELYEYQPERGKNIYHTRAQFLKIGEAVKDFMDTFKRNNPRSSFRDLDDAERNFRRKCCLEDSKQTNDNE